MALSLRRTETPTDAEAFVFFEGFPDATALTQDLNRIFGAEGWVGVSDADAASVLEAATLKTPFAIITVEG